MRAANIDVGRLTGGTGADLRAVLPPRDQWPADNYNHLLEQPTLFYAISIVLAMIGQGASFSVAIAWVYVVLRVLHSLVQVTSNRVTLRFTLFVLGTLALTALVLHAALLFWG